HDLPVNPVAGYPRAAGVAHNVTPRPHLAQELHREEGMPTRAPEQPYAEVVVEPVGLGVEQRIDKDAACCQVEAVEVQHDVAITALHLVDDLRQGEPRVVL